MKACPVHAYAMTLEGIRPEDEAELWAASMSLPLPVMLRGLKLSTDTWVGLADGVPFCMVGVAPYSLIGSKGVPWMVGTVQLDRHAKAFLKACRPVLETILRQFSTLENWVDARNTKAIRWLRWMGFQVEDPQPHGALGLPFCHFVMRRDHV